MEKVSINMHDVMLMAGQKGCKLDGNNSVKWISDHPDWVNGVWEYAGHDDCFGSILDEYMIVADGRNRIFSNTEISEGD